MYSSIFTESEWKSPIQPVYRNAGCSSCGLGRYYAKESFRQFKFVLPTETPAEVPTETPAEVPVYQPDLKQIEGVVSRLRVLPVKQLIEVVEPLLSEDVALKYKRMFPGALRKLIDAYSDEQITRAILYLPQSSIEAISGLQVPAPIQLKARAEGKMIKNDINQNFYNSFLFKDFAEIPRNDPNFSFMDPTFAVGNANSSYAPFNIIVNLDYPYNGVEHYQITSEMTSDRKLILRVGIFDDPEEPMLQVLQVILPLVQTLVKYHYNAPRILFHCRAGISRSATLGVGYYGKQMRLDLTKAYSLMATRRPQISPNPGFIEALETFLG